VSVAIAVYQKRTRIEELKPSPQKCMSLSAKQQRNAIRSIQQSDSFVH
jgi:hypothetical protein